MHLDTTVKCEGCGRIIGSQIPMKYTTGMEKPDLNVYCKSHHNPKFCDVCVEGGYKRKVQTSQSATKPNSKRRDTTVSPFVVGSDGTRADVLYGGQPGGRVPM
ncbi:MAG: hypothetical protein MdMp014T_0299 [Treponematales bacterium]